MSRYIDADALMDNLCANLRAGEVLYRIPPSAIDNAPTIDAEQVLSAQWISVKDRMPKPREDVLVCVYWHEKYQTRPGWYSDQDGLWYVDISAHWKWDLNVTHWMPIPEPPKKEIEEHNDEND